MTGLARTMTRSTAQRKVTNLTLLRHPEKVFNWSWVSASMHVTAEVLFVTSVEKKKRFAAMGLSED